MGRASIGTFVRLFIGASALLSAPMAGLAGAQDRPRPVAEFRRLGRSRTTDCRRGPGSGARSLYLLPRLSCRTGSPLHRATSQSLMATGNLTWISSVHERPAHPRSHHSSSLWGSLSDA